MKPLKVAIEARLQDGVAGGVQQIVLGLASGLSGLQDGDEEYLFHAYPDACEWLRPHMKGPCRLLMGSPLGGGSRGRRLKAALGPLGKIGWLQETGVRLFKRLPESDGNVERAGAELIHFPYQAAFKTTLPSLYQPHDLQHRHLPNFFSGAERYWRNLSYPAWCKQAQVAVMMTHWGKEDLLREFSLDSAKVAVIEGGAVTSAYADPDPAQLKALRQRLGLDGPFWLYPAQAFPHKNHLMLLDALDLLRKDGVNIPLVCTGGRHPHLKVVEARIRALGLDDQVRIAGFVPENELRALYRLATALVFPSRFEGWGLPLTEAFDAGLPVACARATSLPEHAGDAALYFNPDDAVEMAACLKRLALEPALRQELAQKGSARAAAMTWTGAARTFRAWYRRLGGRNVNEEDATLIRQSLR